MRVLLPLLILVLLAAWAAIALAHAPNQNYDLSWWTVDGGGHTFSTGSSYSLGGTIGQPDAGKLARGAYTLGGGFWKGGAVADFKHKVYLPLILRSNGP